MRVAPVTRSISTPQKSKMKPWQSEELISSASVGVVSSGGDQNTVSRKDWLSSGTRPGDQWLVAARREKATALSGLLRARTRPPTNSMSAVPTFSCDAAILASLALIFSAASLAAPPVAAAKRLE